MKTILIDNIRKMVHQNCSPLSKAVESIKLFFVSAQKNLKRIKSIFFGLISLNNYVYEIFDDSSSPKKEKKSE